MSRLLDREIDMAEVEEKIVRNFADVFGYESPAVGVSGAVLSVPPAVVGGSDKNPPVTAGGTDADYRRSEVRKEFV
jgi:hypothetical protein